MIFTAITINFRPDVTQQCAISYRGVYYDITRVDTFEGYKDNLHLYATIKQKQPSASDVYPYPG
ncbi:MAG: head-tail adaptor protein [Firmicutes bacterium]|nr:head-tail adaptor protein [Bacillota bacterium]